MPDRNVLGGELELCGTDPVTGFFRDGCCRTSPEDVGSHTICAVVTVEFLEHQRELGNDLVTPAPHYGFEGLAPGDRWCVTAANSLRAHLDGAAAYVVLRSTHERRSTSSRSPPCASTRSTSRSTPGRSRGPEGRRLLSGCAAKNDQTVSLASIWRLVGPTISAGRYRQPPGQVWPPRRSRRAPPPRAGGSRP